MKSTKPENPAIAFTQSRDPYDVWLQKPTQANLGRVVDSLKPTIDSAMTTYVGAGASPITRSRARYLAIGAIRSYDPTRGAALKTHVMTQLHPLTRYAVQSTQPVKMSERRLRQLKSLQDAEQGFEETHGREPSDAEMADTLGLSIKRINRIRSYATPFIGTDAADAVAGAAPDTNYVDPEDVWIDYVYYDLDDTNRRILDWKLGRNGQPVLSNVEIARRLKVSPAAVTKRAARIQAKLLEGKL